MTKYTFDVSETITYSVTIPAANYTKAKAQIKELAHSRQLFAKKSQPFFSNSICVESADNMELVYHEEDDYA